MLFYFLNCFHFCGFLVLPFLPLLPFLSLSSIYQFIIYPFTHLFTYIYLSIYTFIYTFIYLFIYTFIYLFTHLFIYLFIHLFIYIFTVGEREFRNFRYRIFDRRYNGFHGRILLITVTLFTALSGEKLPIIFVTD